MKETIEKNKSVNQQSQNLLVSYNNAKIWGGSTLKEVHNEKMTPCSAKYCTSIVQKCKSIRLAPQWKVDTTYGKQNLL